MASIERRERKDGKTSWRVIFQRGLNGQRITRTFSTKRAAQTYIREVEGDVDAGRISGATIAARKTLEQAIERHIEESSGKDRSKPQRLRWWAKRYGRVKLSDFSEAHVVDGLDRLRKDVSPASVNRYLTCLSAALRDAQDWRWVARNVARGIRRQREPGGRTRWLDDKERARLFDAIGELAGEGVLPDWFRTWVLLLVTTGMRRGEATRLTWGDVDLQRGVATIEHTKTGKPRRVPLMAQTVAALRDIKPAALPAAPVFPMRNYHQPDRLWYALVERAGLPGVRMHDLRHTAASILAQSNASDLTIAALLGHSTLAMVKRYSHHRTDAVREQLDKAWEGKL